MLSDAINTTIKGSQVLSAGHDIMINNPVSVIGEFFDGLVLTMR